MRTERLAVNCRTAAWIIGGFITSAVISTLTAAANTKPEVDRHQKAKSTSRAVDVFHTQRIRAEFHNILTEFWRWRLHEVPEFSSSVGVHDHDDKLESFTLEAFRHRKEKCEYFLGRLEKIDGRQLTYDDVTSLLVLRYDLLTFVNGYQWLYLSNLNPLNYLEGIHKDFSYWIDSMRFETEQTYVNYTNRLRALVTQIHEQINLMREAIRHNVTYHRLSVNSLVSDIQSLIFSSQHVVSSTFFKPFNDSLEFIGISHSKAELIRSEGLSVIQDHVLPAYRKLAHFVQHEYLRRTRPSEGLNSLPGGLAFYEACLRWYLSASSDVTASTIHQLGRETVDSIQRRIDTVRRRVGYNGKLEDFVKYANGASKWFYRTEDEILEGYRDIVQNKIPAKISAMFYQSAKISPLEVLPMPFDGPAVVLLPGSTSTDLEPTTTEDSSTIFFVNVNEPLRRPKWQLQVTALRETMPGKHLQTCYAQNQSLPAFRRWREYRKMFAVPFQFPFNTAYTEGWALYAEFLGYELDLLQQPIHQFGQMHSELYKACEMVVDSGIHAFGWTSENAVEYLIRTTGVPRSRAESDIHRIVTFPGQATAPEYGHLKLKALRRMAETAQYDRFDIREFHHQILRLGPVPLDVVELVIHQWLSLHSSGVSSLRPESSGINQTLITALIAVLVRLLVVITNR